MRFLKDCRVSFSKDCTHTNTNTQTRTATRLNGCFSAVELGLLPKKEEKGRKVGWMDVDSQTNIVLFDIS